MIMKTIEMYLLATEYSSKVSPWTKRKATNTARTRMYLTQKSPSLTTIEKRFLQVVTIIIRKKRMRKLRDILYIAEGPMHSYPPPELAGHDSQKKYVRKPLHWFR